MSGDQPAVRMGRAAMRGIEEEWRDFALRVFELEVVTGPTGIPVYLRTPERAASLGAPRELTRNEARLVDELRRAFYGGFTSMYGIVTFGLGHESINDTEAKAHLAAISDEIDRFIDSDQELRRRRS